jgi:transposase
MFLAQNGVSVLPLPAVSPNQNTKEHMWDELGRRVRNNHHINFVS